MPLRPVGTRERRIAIEVVTQLVIDLVNRELDVPLPAALALLAGAKADNWMMRILHLQRG